MTSQRTFIALCLALGLTVLAVLPNRVLADQVQSFGQSVKLEPEAGSLQPQDLRGKAILIIFFQSWCPKCNAWSGEMFQQVQAAYGDDPAFVLMAIKTDGGLGEAQQYLSQRKVDDSKWVIGSDAGAAYYVQTCGKDELYGYALIDSDGTIVDKGMAGMFYNTDGGGKNFTLSADKDKLLKKLGQIKPYLTYEPPYPDKLDMAVKQAELGQFGLAIKLTKRYANTEDLKEAVDRLITQVTQAAQQRLDKAKAASQSDDAYVRYLAQGDLARIAQQMGSDSVGQEARKLSAELNRDKLVRDESTAQRMYDAVLAQAGRLAENQRAAFLSMGMKKIAYRYPDTHYGKEAAKQG